MKLDRYLLVFFLFLLSVKTTVAQRSDIVTDAKQAMLNATKYMVEHVSTNGGYVGVYLPDLSRRWGEMEAYKTQIWIGGNIPFTQNMGEIFLDAYVATGDEYYYEAAKKVAGGDNLGPVTGRGLGSYY